MMCVYMKKEIIPAIIAKSQDELNDKISKVDDYVKIIQLDIMDNKFVPNSSLFFDFTLPCSKCFYEAHLMVKDPVSWIEKNNHKVDMILIHYESDVDYDKAIKLVKNKNKKIGFVLNPETPIEKISEYLDKLDQVLIMTVNPGFYGSPFLPEVMEKIRKIRKLKPNLNIEVDGGITDKTITIVDKAGANLFVSGSYIIKSDNIKMAIDSLKEKL
jgi:ribulose-phosphate 3-epimerase